MSDKTKNRKWVTKVIIGFVAALLLLTFFSNTIMNYFIPKVAGKRVAGGTLSFTNNSAAEVEPVTSYKIKGMEGRTVEEVPVGNYDEVKKDDVLVKYKSVEDKSALEGLKKDLKDLEREESYAARTPSETDYASLNLSVSQAEDQLKNAKDQLSKAKNKSEIIKKAEKTIKENKEKLPGLSAEVEKASGTVEELGKKDDELQGKIESAEKKLKKLEPDDGSEPDPANADEIKKLKKEISDLKKDQKENKSKLDAASKRLEKASKKLADCETAIQKAEGTLEEANSLPSVSEAQSSVEEAEANLKSWLVLINCLNGHHFQSHIARFHLLIFPKISLTDDLPKQQKQFGLTVCQRIALNMVAVVIEINGKLSTQPFSIFLRQGLNGIPHLQCCLQFFRIHQYKDLHLPPNLVVTLPPFRRQNYKFLLN